MPRDVAGKAFGSFCPDTQQQLKQRIRGQESIGTDSVNGNTVGKAGHHILTLTVALGSKACCERSMYHGFTFTVREQDSQEGNTLSGEDPRPV